ncbi:hypothetical protein ABPG72_008951 [Tetrahymena utriculariae]
MSNQTIKDVEMFWDEFSDEYSSYDSGSNVLFLSLANMLKIDKRDSILEVGAGTGFLYNHILNYKKQTAKYVATDISDKMIHIMSKRLKLQYIENQVNNYENFNLTIQKANAEQLPFEQESFDCLIGNLCLHITPDPVKMLSESYRVLQKGGVAGFSVWGDDKGLYYYTLIPTVLKEMGQFVQQGRSYFHLNDRESLIKMMESSGFTNIICWNQFTPFHYITEEEMKKVLGTYYSEEITKKVIEKFNEQIKINKKPFGLDALMIIGTKQ